MTHDSVRRAIRTYLQTFIGTLLVVLPAEVIPGASQLLELLAAAAWSGVPAVLAFVLAELEDAGRVRDTRHPKGTP